MYWLADRYGPFLGDLVCLLSEHTCGSFLEMSLFARAPNGPARCSTKRNHAECTTLLPKNGEADFFLRNLRTTHREHPVRVDVCSKRLSSEQHTGNTQCVSMSAASVFAETPMSAHRFAWLLFFGI